MTELLQIDAKFPEKLAPLFTPVRYKILYGGRAGMKSWGIARWLLLRGVQEPGLRVLCAREVMNTIKESVHRLLSDQIEMLHLSQYYEIQQAVIKGPGGTEFNFKGLRHNASEIKSYEGADVCWVEEAHNVSKGSWNYLIPTIRKPKSEIVISFNPELETDETYQRFVVNPPPNSVVIHSSWRDNPWFSEELETERLHMRATDPDEYINIWEGKPRSTLKGAVYAAELRNAELENRITRVPYDPIRPVDTFWDLGWSDMTSIWLVQRIGMEVRLIDFLQDRQRTVTSYLKELQSKEYLYGTMYLPHDAAAKEMRTGKSIEEIVRAANFKTRIVPRLTLTEGINAARTLFSICWFDRERCADGLQALRHYKYETKDGHFSKTPVHDENSHGADSFRYIAVGLKIKGSGEASVHAGMEGQHSRLARKHQIRLPGGLSLGWMGR